MKIEMSGRKFIDLSDYFPSVFFICFFLVGVVSVIAYIRNPKPPLQSESITSIIFPMSRLKQLTLLPNEGGSILLPSDEYLVHLEKLCDRHSPVNWECQWRLGEIRKGFDDISYRINPIYGRPQFTKPQLQSLRLREKRVLGLLADFEYWFVKT